MSECKGSKARYWTVNRQTPRIISLKVKIQRDDRTTVGVCKIQI